MDAEGEKIGKEAFSQLVLAEAAGCLHIRERSKRNTLNSCHSPPDEDRPPLH